eukprot:m.2614 g.2614  ORF g.2614 m.2614 type:complete len:291 (+) comp8795_c0_seq1:534-1406(+)
MGGLLTSIASLTPTQREIVRLRKELISNFSGQKFLILGRPGCGKSSLINSFNYVINLTDPKADYEEIAEVGQSQAETKTRRLTKFDYQRKMYSKLKVADRKKAPAFFDLVGLPNQATLGDLIGKLADGKIEDRTDMLLAVSEEDTSYRENLGREHRKVQKNMAAWTMLLVLSVNEPFPEGLARDIKEAAEMVNLTDERAENLRIFALITKVDTVPQERREEKLETLKDGFKAALNVQGYRALQIVNFTEKDYSEKELKFVRDGQKELQILKVFGSICSGVNTVDPFEETG